MIHLSWKPRAFLYKQFLSEEECEHIIKLVGGCRGAPARWFNLQPAPRATRHAPRATRQCRPLGAGTGGPRPNPLPLTLLMTEIRTGPPSHESV
jgi:hypothetical protein